MGSLSLPPPWHCKWHRLGLAHHQPHAIRRETPNSIWAEFLLEAHDVLVFLLVFQVFFVNIAQSCKIFAIGLQKTDPKKKEERIEMFLASEEEPPKSLSLRLSVVAAYMWKSCYAKLPSLSSKKMVEKLLAMHQLSSKLASFFHAFLIVPPLLKLSYQGGESWRILKNLHLTKKQIQVTNQKIRTTEDIFEFTKLKSASGRNRCFFSIP